MCAKIEAELADLDDADKNEFLADMGLDEPGLNRLIRTGYDLLGLQTYFTAGVKEVRAWTIHNGDTAPQAAGVIHTDFEKGFIRAQTIAFDDFIACKGEQGAKEAGKMRVEGKEYVVQGRRRDELPVQRLMNLAPVARRVRGLPNGAARRFGDRPAARRQSAAPGGMMLVCAIVVQRAEARSPSIAGPVVAC